MPPLLKRNSTEFPFHAWRPYIISSETVYLLTYLQQTLSCFMIVIFTGSFETLVLTMVLYICAQIDIMTKRLNMLPELRKNGVSEGIVNRQESAIIKDCVHHHIHIYS